MLCYIRKSKINEILCKVQPEDIPQELQDAVKLKDEETQVDAKNPKQPEDISQGDGMRVYAKTLEQPEDITQELQGDATPKDEEMLIDTKNPEQPEDITQEDGMRVYTKTPEQSEDITQELQGDATPKDANCAQVGNL
jgi:hypothetical protein